MKIYANRHRIFICTDMQGLYFFWRKFGKFSHIAIACLSIINCRKVVNSQKQSVFWPTLYVWSIDPREATQGELQG